MLIRQFRNSVSAKKNVRTLVTEAQILILRYCFVIPLEIQRD